MTLVQLNLSKPASTYFLPGTEFVKYTGAGEGKEWWCDKHKCTITPIWVRRGDNRSVPACEACFFQTLNIQQRLDLTPVKRAKHEPLPLVVRQDAEILPIRCYVCGNEADAECESCKKPRCIRHMSEDGYFCTDCKSGGIAVADDDTEGAESMQGEQYVAEVLLPIMNATPIIDSDPEVTVIDVASEGMGE